MKNKLISALAITIWLSTSVMAVEKTGLWEFTTTTNGLNSENRTPGVQKFTKCVRTIDLKPIQTGSKTGCQLKLNKILDDLHEYIIECQQNGRYSKVHSKTVYTENGESETKLISTLKNKGGDETVVENKISGKRIGKCTK